MQIFQKVGYIHEIYANLVQYKHLNIYIEREKTAAFPVFVSSFFIMLLHE